MLGCARFEMKICMVIGWVRWLCGGIVVLVCEMSELCELCVDLRCDCFSLVVRTLRKITRQFNVPSGLCVSVLAVWA